MSTSFNEDQIRTLALIQRTGGCLSLISVLLIFIAFASLPRLRTVPNTFIAFASVSNAGAAVACIIGSDGLHQGESSPLCQLQGFLLEMFVQSDPWWSLAMAINVLLVFVHGAKPRSIHRYAWLYCVVCYGGPFAIALTCLLLSSPDKTLVYGDSGAWCWIAPDWRPLRIYTTYLPIWICILTSLAIYTTIGYHLFRASGRHPLPVPSSSTASSRASSPAPTSTFLSPNPTPTPDHINNNLNDSNDRTSRACSTISISDWPLTPTAGGILSMSPTPFSDLLTNVGRRTTTTPVPGDPTLPLRAHSPHRRPPVVQHARYPSNLSNGPASGGGGGLTPFLLSSSPYPRTPTPAAAAAHEEDVPEGMDPVKRTYLTTALLFAIAVTVTWLPGTVKEVWEARNPGAEAVWGIMWQDADPVVGGDGKKEAEGGKGVLSSWRRSKDTVRSSRSKRQDSWDFLDIGMDESQMRGLREKREAPGKVMAVSSEVVGNKELIAGLKDVPGGMI
ncbi:hypothetical protein QBC39DRAFT_433187 [Podospora conica]|nr:hypothetical protein QBC39DRAFT_433187 [Schizothecium conicum]